ncbi:sensor histidine kinase [Rhizobium johnstonii]|uniref:sensor histidine kinase n=1 Tax=Rhizobium johnstonii TaxID=3019933 RepID=UPI003F986C44
MSETTIIVPLSESRHAAIERFRTNIGAEFAILLLADEFGRKTDLSVAYAVGVEELCLQGVRHQFPYDNAVDAPCSYFDQIGADLAQRCGVTSKLGWRMLSYNSPVASHGATFVGAVFYPGSYDDDAGTHLAADLLCRDVEINRLIGAQEAIRSAQRIVQTTQMQEAQIIAAIAEVVKDSINCENFFICERDGVNGWKLIGHPDHRVEFFQPNVAFEVSERVRTIDSYGRGTEGLFVPIHRPFVKLEARPFERATEFVDTIKSKQHTQKAIIFSGRRPSRYLQEAFSHSDRRLCNRVFYSIQSSLASSEYQEKTNWTMKAMLKIGDGVFPSFSVLKEILAGFDRSFSSVGVLRVLRDGEDVNSTIDADYDASVYDRDYESRILKDYLNVFYQANDGEAPDGVFIGLDKAPGFMRLEFHFSSHLNETRIFVVKCDDDGVPEGALRGLIHFFTELHVRHKRSAFLIERADYITQVRHVLVHHLSATLNALSSIQSTWRMSAKDDKLWSEMRKDQDFTRFLDSSVANLTRASKLLELGRFIVDKISPKSLNRKGLNIVAIIEDTFKVLIWNREQRKLTVRAKVKGHPPSIMNGDEELLRIAIINLVDNAIKYSAVGREVFWEVEFRPSTYLFRITSHGDPIQTGNKASLINTRFRAKQLDHLNQRHGTGWGLPVTNKILQAHSPQCRLEFETIVDPMEPNNSRNVFYFEMPYRTGTVIQSVE